LTELVTSKLDLGTMVLAVVKSRDKKGGAFTDEITQSLLALEDKLDFEPISTRPGPTGADSDRVRSLVGVYRVRGYLKEDSPARITEKGEARLESRLKALCKDNNELERFWSLLR